jgi:hypothetical protein
MDEAPATSEVELRLRRLGTTLRSELTTRELVPAVVGALRRDRSERGSRPRRRIAGVAALVVVGLVAMTSTAWAIKTVVFDGGVETVHREPAPTRPLTTDIHLGRRVSLEQARTHRSFLQPDVSWLEASPTAWLDDNVSGQLSLSYPPGPELPDVSSSGLGMVIQMFEGDGREVIRKFLSSGTRTERVTIDGADAVFLHGGDHTLFYLKDDGSYSTAPGRLVGNALILRIRQLTVRIEAELPLARIVEVAESLRPARHS